MIPEDVKLLINNSEEPLVFNNLLEWEIVRWDVAEWSNCLGDTELQYRLGCTSFTEEPQWEKTCELITGTFQDFVHFNEDLKWLYFDYKYLNQWFIDKFNLREAISWAKFGYPEITAEESTIWIGNKGAHTPCHIDTYGCNLVAQITGRKLWLLFPPHTNLQPTRIPYEESTIYSSINFFTPSEESLAKLASDTACKKIILEPGQVLFVPHGWWHYVENLDISISINTWIPMPGDKSRQIDEAITLMMIKLFTNGLQTEDQNRLINCKKDVDELSNTDVFNLVQASISGWNDEQLDARNCNIDNVLQKSNSHVRKMANMEFNDLMAFLRRQLSRFPTKSTKSIQQLNSDSILTKKYLSVIVDNDVIALIRKKLQAFDKR